MTVMRAKFQIGQIEKVSDSYEILNMSAVGLPGAYPEDGSDEDNTFAKFTPSATCQIHIANPALIGKFEPGQKFYVDFTPAD